MSSSFGALSSEIGGRVEWGAMLNQGRLFFQSDPRLMVYPGWMISLTVLGFNLLADGLRNVPDPLYIR